MSNTNISHLKPIYNVVIEDVNFIVAGGENVSTVPFLTEAVLAHKNGDLVCIDSEGEVFSATSDQLIRRGRKVHKITGGAKDNFSFNLIGWLNPASPSFIEDCKKVTQWLVAPKLDISRNDSGSNYFDIKARDLFALVLAYEVFAHFQRNSRGEVSHFPTLASISAQFATEPSTLCIDTIADHLGRAFGISVISKILIEWCGPFIGGEVGRAWPNICAAVKRDVNWLGDSSIASLISGHVSNGSDARAGQAADILDQNTAIFLCLPVELTREYPALKRLILGSIICIVRQQKEFEGKTTSFLIDEMESLGYFPFLHGEIVHQGILRGIRIFGICQTLESFAQAAGDEACEPWLSRTRPEARYRLSDIKWSEHSASQVITKSPWLSIRNLFNRKSRLRN